MNSVASSRISQTTSVLAFAFGAVMAAEPTEWPTQETPNYRIENVATSYSSVLDQIMNNSAKQNPIVDFARDMASIYTSLSQRQERLGKEFETAIFEDIESLYEA